MIGFSLSQMAREIEARQLGEDVRFASVSTDTRTLRSGDLFVALTGPNFDGHDYLAQAFQQGAVAALVQRDTGGDYPRLLVEDTRLALGRMAAVWRQQGDARVIAVTGSNGKTTVKEMIAAILGQKGPVLATRGNLNNDIGVPLTLLRLQEERYAVIELGANHPGEISYLSKIAMPDIALLNNACRSHLEGFGSIEGVAKAKSEIVNGLGESGCFVYNADDNFAPFWGGVAAGRRTLTFGVCQEADVSSQGDVEVVWDESGFSSRFEVQTPGGEVKVELALAGEHNRMNALAAIAAAQEAGATLAEIRQGLARIKPVRGRLQPLPGKGGVMLVDDSYNANPDSVAAAIRVLASAPGRRFLLLGELGELGKGTCDFYRELGREAREAGIDHLYGVAGAAEAARCFGDGGAGFEDREQLVDHLRQVLRPGDRVLVKGSRLAAMDRVVDALTDGERD